MSNPQFTHPPPLLKTQGCTITFPSPNILLVTLTRPKQMNSIPFPLHWELDSIFTWYDAEPSLRVAIITGTGKAFCAGQDLIELMHIGMMDAEEKAKIHPATTRHAPSGFAGLSRRRGKKPVIAAVNGFALGGGFEIVLNCDMVVASPHATFGLPEAKRGIYAAEGGPSRLVRIVGLPLASEIALTGRPLTAQEALSFRIINRVSKSPADVLTDAITLANEVCELSPDSVIVTRAALREALENPSVERATQTVQEMYAVKLREGENVQEGLSAFAEKRRPNWRPSRL